MWQGPGCSLLFLASREGAPQAQNRRSAIRDIRLKPLNLHGNSSVCNILSGATWSCWCGPPTTWQLDSDDDSFCKDHQFATGSVTRGPGILLGLKVEFSRCGAAGA